MGDNLQWSCIAKVEDWIGQCFDAGIIDSCQCKFFNFGDSGQAGVTFGEVSVALTVELGDLVAGGVPLLLVAACSGSVMKVPSMP